MAVTIPDEVLLAAQMSEAELRQELAVLLFQRERLTLVQAARLASMIACIFSIYSLAVALGLTTTWPSFRMISVPCVSLVGCDRRQ